MCSRPNCHTRECDENLKSKKIVWTNSPIFMKKTLLGDVRMLQAKKAKLDSSNETADGRLATATIEIKTLQEQKQGSLSKSSMGNFQTLSRILQMGRGK